MLILKDLHTTPPGGWRYYDYDTGQSFQAKTLEEVVELVDQCRENNRKDPLPDTEAIILDYICRLAAKTSSCCKEVDTPRTLADYWRGAKALVKGVFAKFVDQPVAELRAATCLNCKQNRPLDKHTAMRYYTDQVAARSIGARKTSLDAKLYSCNICTCVLRVKVHYNQSLVEDDLTPEHRALMPNGVPGKNNQPLYCWCIRPDKIEEKLRDISNAIDKQQ